MALRLSPSLEALIAFRVLQGAVAGPMIPLSQALMLASFPKSKAGMALAVWSMTTLVAPVAGPLLGGWISDNHTWPWIFYINVPVGLLAAWISWRIYRDRESPTRKLPIDKLGLVLLVVWVGALQIMLDKGKELDWFASPTILILAAVAVVAFVFFLIWELTDAHPVVDLRLFKVRNFTVGALTLAAPTACSSATWCCCRSGCKATWVTRPPTRAWSPRRWVGHPADAGRGQDAGHAGSAPDRHRGLPDLRAGVLHALGLQYPDRCAHADDADHHPGRGHGGLLRAP